MGFEFTDSTNLALKIVFSIYGWESMDAVGCIVLCHFIKELERMQMLVSEGDSGTISSGCQSKIKFWGSPIF